MAAGSAQPAAPHSAQLKAAKRSSTFGRHSASTLALNNFIPYNQAGECGGFSGCNPCVGTGSCSFCRSTWQCIPNYLAHTQAVGDKDLDIWSCPYKNFNLDDLWAYGPSDCPAGVEVALAPYSLVQVAKDVAASKVNATATSFHYRVTGTMWLTPTPQAGARLNRTLTVQWNVVARSPYTDTTLQTSTQQIEFEHAKALEFDFAFNISDALVASNSVFVQAVLDPDQATGDDNFNDNVLEAALPLTRIAKLTSALSGTFLHGQSLSNKIYVLTSQPLRDSDTFRVYLDDSRHALISVAARFAANQVEDCNVEINKLKEWYPSSTLYSFFIDMAHFQAVAPEMSHTLTVQLHTNQQFIDSATLPFEFKSHWLYVKAYNLRFADLQARLNDPAFYDVSDYVIRASPSACPSYFTTKVPINFPLTAAAWDASLAADVNNAFLSGNLTDGATAFHFANGLSWRYSSAPPNPQVDSSQLGATYKGFASVSILGAKAGATIDSGAELTHNWELNQTVFTMKFKAQGEWPVKFTTGTFGTQTLAFQSAIEQNVDLHFSPAQQPSQLSGAETDPAQLFDFGPSQPIQRISATILPLATPAPGASRSFVRTAIKANGRVYMDIQSRAANPNVLYGAGVEQLGFIGQYLQFGVPLETVQFSMENKCFPASRYFAENCTATLSPTSDGFPYLAATGKDHQRLVNTMKAEMKQHFQAKAYTQQQSNEKALHEFVLNSVLDVAELRPIDDTTASLERALYDNAEQPLSFSPDYIRLPPLSSVNAGDVPSQAHLSMASAIMPSSSNAYTLFAYETVNAHSWDGSFNSDTATNQVFIGSYSLFGSNGAGSRPITAHDYSVFFDRNNPNAQYDRCTFFPHVAPWDQTYVLMTYTSVDCYRYNGTKNSIDMSTADIVVRLVSYPYSSQFVFSTYKNLTSVETNSAQQGINGNNEWYQNTPIRDQELGKNAMDAYSVSASCDYFPTHTFGSKSKIGMTVWVRDADANPATINDQSFMYTTFGIEGTNIIAQTAKKIPTNVALSTDERLTLTCVGHNLVLTVTNTPSLASTSSSVFVAKYDLSTSAWSDFAALHAEHADQRAVSAAIADSNEKLVFAWIHDEQVYTKTFDPALATSALSSVPATAIVTPGKEIASTHALDLSCTTTGFGVVCAWWRPGFLVFSARDNATNTWGPVRVVATGPYTISDLTLQPADSQGYPTHVRAIFSRWTYDDGANYIELYESGRMYEGGASQFRSLRVDFGYDLQVSGFKALNLPTAQPWGPQPTNSALDQPVAIDYEVEIKNAKTIASPSTNITIYNYRFDGGLLSSSNYHIPPILPGQALKLRATYIPTAAGAPNSNALSYFKASIADNALSYGPSYYFKNTNVYDRDLNNNNAYYYPTSLVLSDLEWESNDNTLYVYYTAANNGPVKVTFSPWLYFGEAQLNADSNSNYRIDCGSKTLSAWSKSTFSCTVSSSWNWGGPNTINGQQVHSPLTLQLYVRRFSNYHASYFHDNTFESGYDLNANRVEPLKVTVFDVDRQHVSLASNNYWIGRADSEVFEIEVYTTNAALHAAYPSFYVVITDFNTNETVTSSYGQYIQNAGYYSFSMSIYNLAPGPHQFNVTLLAVDDYWAPDWNAYDNSFLLNVTINGLSLVQFDANSTVYIPSSNSFNVYLSNQGNMESGLQPVSVLLYDHKSHIDSDWRGVLLGSTSVSSIAAGACSVVPVPIDKLNVAEVARRLLQWKFYLESTLCLLTTQTLPGANIQYVKNCIPLHWLRLNTPRPCLSQNADSYLAFSRTSASSNPTAHVLLNSVGTYNIELQTDGICSSSTVQRTIEVRCDGSEPSAQLEVSSDSIVLGDHVLLNASLSFDDDADEQLAFSWYFNSVPADSKQRTGLYDGPSALITPHFSVAAPSVSHGFDPRNNVDEHYTFSGQGLTCALLTGKPIQQDGFVSKVTYYAYSSAIRTYFATYRAQGGLWVPQGFYRSSHGSRYNQLLEEDVPFSQRWSVRPGDVIGVCHQVDWSDFPVTFQTTFDDDETTLDVYQLSSDINDEPIGPPSLNFYGANEKTSVDGFQRYKNKALEVLLTLDNTLTAVLPSYPVVYFTPDAAGHYELVLRVSDGCHSAEESVSVHVLCPHQFAARIAPIADPVWSHYDQGSGSIQGKFTQVEFDASSTEVFNTVLLPTVQGDVNDNETLSTLQSYTPPSIAYEWELLDFQPYDLTLAPTVKLADGSSWTPDFVGIRRLALDRSSFENEWTRRNKKYYECYAKKSVSFTPTGAGASTGSPQALDDLVTEQVTTTTERFGKHKNQLVDGDGQFDDYWAYTTQSALSQHQDTTFTNSRLTRTLSTYQSEGAQELSISLGLIVLDGATTPQSTVTLFPDSKETLIISDYGYSTAWYTQQFSAACQGLYTMSLTASVPCHSSVSVAKFRTQCNSPPVAQLSCDRTILSGNYADGSSNVRWLDQESWPFTYTAIDGTLSTDADGDALIYYWKVEGPSFYSDIHGDEFKGVADYVISSAPLFWLQPQSPGVYNVSVIVSDGCSNHTDSVLITAVCREFTAKFDTKTPTIYYTFGQWYSSTWANYNLSVVHSVPVQVPGFGPFSELLSGATQYASFLPIATRTYVSTAPPWSSYTGDYSPDPGYQFSSADLTTTLTQFDAWNDNIQFYADWASENYPTNYTLAAYLWNGCSLQTLNVTQLVQCAPLTMWLNWTTEATGMGRPDARTDTQHSSNGARAVITVDFNTTTNTYPRYLWDLRSSQHNIPSPADLNNDGVFSVSFPYWQWYTWSNVYGGYYDAHYNAYWYFGDHQWWYAMNDNPSRYGRGYIQPWFAGAYTVELDVGDDCQTRTVNQTIVAACATVPDYSVPWHITAAGGVGHLSVTAGTLADVSPDIQTVPTATVSKLTVPYANQWMPDIDIAIHDRVSGSYSGWLYVVFPQDDSSNKYDYWYWPSFNNTGTDFGPYDWFSQAIYVFEYEHECQFIQHILIVDWACEAFDFTLARQYPNGTLVTLPLSGSTYVLQMDADGDSWMPTTVTATMAVASQTKHYIQYTEYILRSAPANSLMQQYIDQRVYHSDSDYYSCLDYWNSCTDLVFNTGSQAYGDDGYLTGLDVVGDYVFDVVVRDYCQPDTNAAWWTPDSKGTWTKTRQLKVQLGCAGVALDLTSVDVWDTFNEDVNSPQLSLNWVTYTLPYTQMMFTPHNTVTNPSGSTACRFGCVWYRYKFLSQPSDDWLERVGRYFADAFGYTGQRDLTAQIPGWFGELYNSNYIGFTDWKRSSDYSDYPFYAYLPGDYSVKFEAYYGKIYQGNDLYRSGGCGSASKTRSFTLTCASSNPTISVNASVNAANVVSSPDQVALGGPATQLDMYGRYVFTSSSCNAPTYTFEARFNKTRLSELKDNVVFTAFQLLSEDVMDPMWDSTAFHNVWYEPNPNANTLLADTYTYTPSSPDRAGLQRAQYAVVDACYRTRFTRINFHSSCESPTLLAPAPQTLKWRGRVLGYEAALFSVGVTYPSLSGSEQTWALNALRYYWTLTSAPAASRFSLENTADCAVTQNIELISGQRWVVLKRVCRDAANPSAAPVVTFVPVLNANSISSPQASFTPDVPGVYTFTMTATPSTCQACPSTNVTMQLTATCAPITPPPAASHSVSLLSDGHRFAEAKFDAAATVYDGDFAHLEFVWVITGVPALSSFEYTHDWSNSTISAVTFNQFYRRVSDSQVSLISSTLTQNVTSLHRVFAALDNPNGDRTCFTPDYPGTYTFELRIGDACPLSEPVTQAVTLSASCDSSLSIVNASNANVTLTPHEWNRFELAQFISVSSSSPMLHYKWAVNTLPAASTEMILSQPDSKSAYFVPDVAGTYYFNVEVSTVYGCSYAKKVVKVDVYCPSGAEASTEAVVSGFDIIRWSQTRSKATSMASFTAIAGFTATSGSSAGATSSPSKFKNAWSVTPVSKQVGSDSDSGLSRGAKIAIAVCLSVVGLVAIVVGVTYCMKATKSSKVSSTQ